jgi:hypothetical protein
VDKTPVAGTAWPGATHGEVRSPSGRRSYTPQAVAGFLRLSDRRVRQWATGGNESTRLPAEREHRGNREYLYLDADAVEARAAQRGLWPPSKDQVPPADDDAWQELFAKQGQDLERTRAELQQAHSDLLSLRNKVASLKDEVRSLNIDRRDLAEALARASAVLSRSAIKYIDETE